jgi:hypothetical protein
MTNRSHLPASARGGRIGHMFDSALVLANR